MIFDLFRWLHIAGGFVALFVFWIPIVTKKGGKVHHVVGWIYVWSMAIVAISAFYMGAYRIFFDEIADADRIAFSWFLIFISILSSASAWYGIRVLKFKKRQEGHKRIVDLGYSALLFLSGIGMSIYGITLGSPLLTYFPIVGISLGAMQLAYWLRPAQKKMHWLFEHFSGMLACCISTVTAFMVFGAPRLLNIESVSVWLWFAPTILLTPVIIGFSIYYGKKYSKRT